MDRVRPKIRASTRRCALRALSRARARRRDPVAPRPKPPAHSAKNNNRRRPGARLRFTAPPPMDKVRPENQSEHTPVCPNRVLTSPSAAPRPRTSAATAAGAFVKNNKKPARPDARPRFSAPPPMDKVRPENQSEHTPECPNRVLTSPSAAPRPRTSAATAASASSKTTKAGPARRAATIFRTAANG